LDDFGDKLNAILNDPAALSRIGELAKSVMGGEQEKGDGEEPEFDPGLISRIMGLLKRNGVKSDERALLEAMKPFLSERRREKMDKAIKLARLASIAGIAASELGLGEGDGDV
jgi:hypothetical protein